MEEQLIQNQNPSQDRLVLEYIRANGSITTLDAFIDLGITRLSARIYGLRQKGFAIVNRTEKVKNRRGQDCVVKRYFLDEEKGERK